MYVGLDQYGKYKIFKSEEKMLTQKNDFSMLIFDCSSYLKGPVHTLVKTKDIFSIPHALSFKVKFQYSSSDLPWIEEYTNTTECDIHNMTELYTVISMLYQYEQYNFFIMDHSYEATNEILTQDIIIQYQKEASIDKLEIFHYFYDSPCSHLTKFLEKHGMRLSANKVIGNKFLVLDNDGNYKISKEIPNEFKYIGLPIIGSQSFYLISYKKYCRFIKISDLEVSIGNRVKPNTKFMDEEVYISCDFFIQSISTLVAALLFIPQYILLQKVIFNEENTLEINMTYDKLDYKITANENDVSGGVSLFKIIDSITKI